MADQKLLLPAKTLETVEIPPELDPPTPTTHQPTQIHISIPRLGDTPSGEICSYNRCEGCKALFPISGLALVNCPGCQQPTLLIKLANCPKCNEPASAIRLRVDHVSDKMPHGAHCKGQLGVGDTFLVDIEKPAWRDDDHRIKDTTTSPKQGTEYTKTETNTETETKTGDCGCSKKKQAKQGE